MHFASLLGRLAAVLVAAAAVTGCSGHTDFTISKNFDVSTTGGALYEYQQPVDLAAEAGNAWKHRSKIKRLELVGLDGTITAVQSGSGTTGGGTIYLRPDGGTGSSDVEVGTWPATEPVVAPHSLSVALSPGAVGVIEGALRGSGKFTVLLSGTTVDPAAFTANVSLHVKLTYKIP